MSRKHVTWSPIVAPISRPNSIAKKTRRRRSVIVFDHKGKTRRVEGNLVAHSRRNTHTTLLTIRNAHHRDMQLLIDLPARRVRKIYNGESSFTVDESSSDTIRIRFERFGTVIWKDDDNTVRKPDARGFSLTWLKDNTHWPIRQPVQNTRRKQSRRYTSKSRGKSKRRQR